MTIDKIKELEGKDVAVHFNDGISRNYGSVNFLGNRQPWTIWKGKIAKFMYGEKERFVLLNNFIGGQLNWIYPRDQKQDFAHVFDIEYALMKIDKIDEI